MPSTVDFDELKRLHDRARIAPPGSKDWLKFATTMMESFPALYETARAMNARMAELQERLGKEWTAATDKLHPEKPGLSRYEQVPCLIVRNREILIRLWNCEHQVWDTEDGDDFYCEAKDVSHWMPLPDLPAGKKKGD